MEPTTVIILLAFASPALPTRLRTMSEMRSGEDAAASRELATQIRDVIPTPQITIAAMAPVEPVISRLEDAVRQVRGFNVPASGDAERFLASLPAGFPIPLTACGEDEVVTLFWDTGEFYADIEFHGSGLMSAFTRARGKPNVDHCENDISLDQAFNTWGYRVLGPLAPALHSQAA